MGAFFTILVFPPEHELALSWSRVMAVTHEITIKSTKTKIDLMMENN
jgi:hypothetical protein